MKRIAAFLVLVLLAAGCGVGKKATAVVAMPGGPAGVIEGIVSMNGHPLPGATVTITSRKGDVRTAITDTNGRYVFTNVQQGRYTIVYMLAGLTPVTRHVAMYPTQGVRANAELRLSSVAEAITVMSEAPLYIADGLVVNETAVNGAISAEYGGKVSGVEGGVVGGVVGGTVGGVPAPAPPPPPSLQALAYQGKVEPARQSEAYKTFEDHKFAKANDAPTTTFSIDVDRASYTNVRLFLSHGQLPPADAVRVEEMINYFPYKLPQPKGDVPFSITTETASCPWNPNNRLLRIGIQGRNLDDWKMAPNNLVFLLDVSGSMDPPERLPLLKSAFKVLVDKLRAEDRVAIVVYAGAAGLALPSTSGADKATINAALDNLRAGGSTAGGEGIELAYRVARDNFIPNGNNRVILATDGDFNVGIHSLDDLEQLIVEKRKSGIAMTTIGVGSSNYRDSVLELLADKGNGNYSYLDSLKEAKKVFGRELTGTLVTIAKDVKVQIEFDPRYVESYRQIGYENRALENKDFADDTKDAGELGAGHSVTALYEIVPAATGSTGQLAQIRLRYKAPNGDTSALIETVAHDDGKSIWQASNDLQFAAAVAQFGMMLRGSAHGGINAKYADVLQLARMAGGDDPDGLRDEFIRLVDTTRSLRGEAPPAIAGQ